MVPVFELVNAEAHHDGNELQCESICLACLVAIRFLWSSCHLCGDDIIPTVSQLLKGRACSDSQFQTGPCVCGGGAIFSDLLILCRPCACEFHMLSVQKEAERFSQLCLSV